MTALPSTLRRAVALTAAVLALLSLLWLPTPHALVLLACYAAPLALWAHRRSLATRAAALASIVLLTPGTWLLALFIPAPLLLGPWGLTRRNPSRTLALASIAVAFAAGISPHPAPGAALVATFATLAVTPYDRRLAVCATTAALGFALVASAPLSAVLALVGASLMAAPLRFAYRRPNSRTGRTSGAARPSTAALADGSSATPGDPAPHPGLITTRHDES